MSRSYCKMQGAKSKLQQVTFSCDLIRIAVAIERLLACFRSLQMNRKSCHCVYKHQLTNIRGYAFVTHVIIMQPGHKHELKQ